MVKNKEQQRQPQRFATHYYAEERKVLFLVTLFGLIFQGSDGVKDVQLEGPRYARRGEDLMLRCSYNLERDTLYALKWYRGSEEFYRFLPKESPPKQAFPIAGVAVDVNKSDDHGVFLRNLSFETSGRFKCVISAEGTFQTLENAKDIDIVVIDYNSPKLFLDKMSYQPGDRGLANCSIERTFPVPNITWFINGKKVNSSWVTREVKIVEEEGFKKTSTGSGRMITVPSSISTTVFPNHVTHSIENASFSNAGFTSSYNSGTTSKSSLVGYASPNIIYNSSTNTYYFNGVVVSSVSNNKEENVDGKRKLSSSISTLSFPVQSYSPIRIKCWGQLYDLYNETSSINIQPKAPTPLHYPYPTQSSASSASGNQNQRKWNSLPDQFHTQNSTYLGGTNQVKPALLLIFIMIYFISPFPLLWTLTLIKKTFKVTNTSTSNMWVGGK